MYRVPQQAGFALPGPTIFQKYSANHHTTWGFYIDRASRIGTLLEGKDISMVIGRNEIATKANFVDELNNSPWGSSSVGQTVGPIWLADEIL